MIYYLTQSIFALSDLAHDQQIPDLLYTFNAIRSVLRHPLDELASWRLLD